MDECTYKTYKVNVCEVGLGTDRPHAKLLNKVFEIKYKTYAYWVEFEIENAFKR